MLPQRQSSRPPKPVQPNPNYDYDLELPPAHKLPPRPKSYGRCGADQACREINIVPHRDRL